MRRLIISLWETSRDLKRETSREKRRWNERLEIIVERSENHDREVDFSVGREGTKKEGHGTGSLRVSSYDSSQTKGKDP